ncbi:MAG: hypothetical protein M1831_007131 [Alyxoria varia]|nr:MAG: hypothetical protein M1831_007131 [Alyxoria varia]
MLSRITILTICFSLLSSSTISASLRQPINIPNERLGHASKDSAGGVTSHNEISTPKDGTDLEERHPPLIYLAENTNDFVFNRETYTLIKPNREVVPCDEEVGLNSDFSNSETLRQGGNLLFRRHAAPAGTTSEGSEEKKEPPRWTNLELPLEERGKNYLHTNRERLGGWYRAIVREDQVKVERSTVLVEIIGPRLAEKVTKDVTSYILDKYYPERSIHYIIPPEWLFKEWKVWVTRRLYSILTMEQVDSSWTEHLKPDVEILRALLNNGEVPRFTMSTPDLRADKINEPLTNLFAGDSHIAYLRMKFLEAAETDARWADNQEDEMVESGEMEEPNITYPEPLRLVEYEKEKGRNWARHRYQWHEAMTYDDAIAVRDLIRALSNDFHIVRDRLSIYYTQRMEERTNDGHLFSDPGDLETVLINILFAHDHAMAAIEVINTLPREKFKQPQPHEYEIVPPDESTDEPAPTESQAEQAQASPRSLTLNPTATEFTPSWLRNA